MSARNAKNLDEEEKKGLAAQIYKLTLLQLEHLRGGTFGVDRENIAAFSGQKRPGANVNISSTLTPFGRVNSCSGDLHGPDDLGRALVMVEPSASWCASPDMSQRHVCGLEHITSSERPPSLDIALK